MSFFSVSQYSGGGLGKILNLLIQPKSTQLLSLLRMSASSESHQAFEDNTKTPINDGQTPGVLDKEEEKKKKKWSKNQMKKFKRREAKRKAVEEGTIVVKKPRKKADFYDQGDILEETSYYFEQGLRKVYPYPFKFSTFAKGRWCKRTLLDVFCHEFKHFPEHVFKEKIKEGQVCVNNEPVDLEYRLKDNDFITHMSHRHEVPVTDEPIQIVHECQDLLVVNKPSSVPCHPCGSFRHNSLIYILWREQQYRGLKFVHRIDRLTSGLLLLAKNEAKAAKISRQVADRLVQKEYVCRVDGEFPEGDIECTEPLDVLSHKLGLQKVCHSGKEAKTTFTKMSYNGKSSVVHCLPHTGRTHQIRVHLQYLGYPIMNDPLYNSDIWGPQRGKGGDYGKSESEVIQLMMKDHDKMKYVNAEAGSASTADDIESSDVLSAQNSTEDPAQTSTVDSMQSERKTMIEHCSNSNENDLSHNDNAAPKSTSSMEPTGSCDSQANKDNLDTLGTDPNRPRFDPAKMTYDPTCLDCRRQFKDPKPEDLVMYLHALKYKGPDWEFETPLPLWAATDWIDR